MNTDAILELLKDVADRVINPRFRLLAEHEIVQKAHAEDLVTVADREAETEITEALSTAYPEAVVLGEEAYAADPTTLDRFLEADHGFTLDPIDGTWNFVHGSPDHSVMLSEVRSGFVVRAWLWNPQHNTGYVAERGAGVTVNGTLLSPPESAASDPWRLHTQKVPWQGRPIDGVGTLQPTWLSCGIDYSKLASGDADVLVYGGTQLPWDHAPGSLMITELDGHVGFADGTAYAPCDTRPTREPVTLIAASTPAIFEAAAAGIRQSSLT